MAVWNVLLQVDGEYGGAQSASIARAMTHTPLRGAPKLLVLGENGEVKACHISFIHVAVSCLQANVDTSQATIKFHDPSSLQYSVHYAGYEAVLFFSFLKRK